jgi:hypothetical protein
MRAPVAADAGDDGVTPLRQERLDLSVDATPSRYRARRHLMEPYTG